MKYSITQKIATVFIITSILILFVYQKNKEEYITSDTIIIADRLEGHGQLVKNAFMDAYGSDISDRIEILPNIYDAFTRAEEINAQIIIHSYSGFSGYDRIAKQKYPNIAVFMPLGINQKVRIPYPTEIPHIITSCAGITSCETAFGQPLEFWSSDGDDQSPHLSSVSNAIVAAQILKIKEALGSSWWEARYRARITAERTALTHPNNREWNEKNGYGKIDLLAAINFSGLIPQDPYLNK